eukprot:GHVT01007112.1.p3 GENE.GHVT01007112.1~~GHVT01007112.1.p3  ORF type:complete len:103 (-),score=15.01 GHVT01007112.1:1303-1611(-)
MHMPGRIWRRLVRPPRGGAKRGCTPLHLDVVISATGGAALPNGMTDSLENVVVGLSHLAWVGVLRAAVLGTFHDFHSAASHRPPRRRPQGFLRLVKTTAAGG